MDPISALCATFCFPRNLVGECLSQILQSKSKTGGEFFSMYDTLKRKNVVKTRLDDAELAVVN